MPRWTVSPVGVSTTSPARSSAVRLQELFTGGSYLRPLTNALAAHERDALLPRKHQGQPASTSRWGHIWHDRQHDRADAPCGPGLPGPRCPGRVLLHAADRKSTRLNSSHVEISYAVFCLKKKKKKSVIFRYQKKKKKK